MKTYGLNAAEKATLERATEGIEPAPFLLTAGEAAVLLRLSRGQVYAMAKRDELPTVRLGSAIRIHRGALLRMLDEAVKDWRP